MNGLKLLSLARYFTSRTNFTWSSNPSERFDSKVGIWLRYGSRKIVDCHCPIVVNVS